MFSSNNIRRRVLATVVDRIEDGQNRYNHGADLEDQSLADSISALAETNRRNKESLEDRIVKEIIGA